jgi:DNA-binding phage protein
MTLEQIRKALEDRNLAEVARRTGVSRDTLYRIASGVGAPSYDTLKSLSDYLTGGEVNGG